MQELLNPGGDTLILVRNSTSRINGSLSALLFLTLLVEKLEAGKSDRSLSVSRPHFSVPTARMCASCWC